MNSSRNCTMSRVSEDLIRKLVRELVRQELDEANSTASVGGSYNTPHAFGGSNKKGKGKGKAGYTGGHDEPTDGTGHFIADDPKLRKESINEAVKKLSVHFPKRTVKRMPEVEKFVKKFVPKAKFERKGNVLHIDGRGKSLKRLSQSIYNEFLVDKLTWDESINESAPREGLVDAIFDLQRVTKRINFKKVREWADKNGRASAKLLGSLYNVLMMLRKMK